MGSFGGGLEQITVEMDPRSVLQAVAQMNAAVADMEKGIDGSGNKVNRTWQSISETMLRATDKSKNAADSYVRSLERQAAAVGKSGIDKLNAQMEQAIKNYGYSEAAINKITTAYEKMAKAQEQAEGKGGFSAGQRAGLGAKDLFEGRNAYAAVEFGKSLSELKGAPAVLGAVAATLTAAAAAGWEAAKSLGEYGTKIRDVELRTGLTATQVGQFGYAARAVGQDVSVVERTMRGLTAAIEDDSEKGQKARDVLRGFGVDIAGLKDGTVPTRDLLVQISEGLNGLHNNWEKNAAGMALFKKAGIDLLPFMQELKENLRDAQNLNFASEEDIGRFRDYQKQIAAIGTEWDHLAIKFKEPLAATILFTLKTLGEEGPTPKPVPGLTLDTMTNRAVKAANVTPELSDFLQQMGGGPKRDPNEATIQAALARWGRTKEGIEKAIAEAKKDETKALEELKNHDIRGVADLKKAEADILRNQNSLEALTSGKRQGEEENQFILGIRQRTEGQAESPLRKILTERDASVREVQEKFKDRPSAERDALSNQVMSLYANAFLAQLQKDLAGSQKKAAEELSKTDLERSKDAELGLPSFPTFQKNGLVLPGAYPTGPYVGSAGVDLSNNKEAMRIASENAKAGLFPSAIAGEGIQIPLTPGMGTPPGPSSRQQADLTKDMLAQESKRIELMAGPGGELAAARQILELKKQALSIDEGQAELEAQAITNQTEREKKIFDIRLEYSRQIYDAESQYQDKLLERQKQVAETAAGLYHTLFTNPKKFAPQLENTLKEAALKPVTEGLGNLTAQAIFGGNRGGGLKDVRSTNGAMHVFVTNLGGGGPGPAPINLSGGYSGGGTIPSFGGGGPSSSSTVSLPYFGASGPLFGGGTTSSPSFGAAGPISGGSTRGGFNLASLFGRGPGPSASDQPGWTGTAAPPPGGYDSLLGGNPASLIGPGGTAPFIGNGGSDGAGVLSKGIGGALGSLKGIGGGGGGSGSGGNFGVLGAANGGPLGQEGGPFSGFGPGSAGGFGTGSGPMGLSSGVGGPAGAALGGTGLAIAENGLTGRNEGTGKGVAEGAIGGAMVGMQYGGPIGAAIGAAVGAGIGVGEMLAGVMSPWAKAAMYAKQLYGITINDNMQNQIVNIAKGSFGGNIQLAVRSPQVRQMLGLYAAGTGQANAKALMDSTPHGAGLSQQGGVTYQDTSYLYGQSYKYSSSLPTLGGTNTTQTYSSPTAYAGSQAPVNLSLNIDGKNAGDFMAGNVVTPDFVQDQWSSSQMSSNGRVSNSALLQEPGLITA